MTKLQDKINKKVDEFINSASDSLSLEGYRYSKEPITLPAALVNAKNLRHLELAGLSITNLDMVLQLTCLESFKVVEVGGIDKIIEDLDALKNLTKLDIEFEDEATRLPDNWANFKLLQSLRLVNTDFAQFPEVLGELQSLESFCYEEGVYVNQDCINVLERLPRLKKCGFVKMHIPYSLPFIDDGSWEYTLPENIAKLQSIEELDLSDNIEMVTLPESIGDLKKLRSLKLYIAYYDAEVSYFTNLPESIGKLSQLGELDVYGLLKLERLPETIENLTSWSLKMPQIFELS